MPAPLLLAAGTALESLILFLLLLTDRFTPAALAAMAAAALLPLPIVRPRPAREPAVAELDRSSRWLFAIVFGAFGILYLIYALGPETEFDALNYHLALPAEYLRLGGFPDRIGFFEVLPQGLEMLYAFSAALGGAGAARLTHFAFLALTPAMFLAVGRRLGLPDSGPFFAAAFYFCAPVVGVAGTSVHNDAPMVFFVLAAFYLLLRWRGEANSRWLIPGGLAAGFCYAVKLPGLIVPGLLVLYLLFARRVRPALIAGLSALPAIAPWMIRAFVLTGNPVAPMMNAWFPNPFFHLSSELELARRFTHGDPSLAQVPLHLALGGPLEGFFGPMLLALPLGLLALRRKNGLLVVAAAAALALPWFLNHGARFLMPGFALMSVALGMALPRSWLWPAVLLHALTCWPQVIPLYARAGAWEFKELPWRAALRLEPEREYLKRAMAEYPVLDLLEKHTRPGERIFAVIGVPKVYARREVLEFWHSAEADRLLDSLKVAAFQARDPFYDVRADWMPAPLRALRFRLPRGEPEEWYIHELDLYDGERRLPPGRGWSLDAWPNPWETPWMLDGNRATRWRTWEPVRAGAFVEVAFDHPQTVSSAVLLAHIPGRAPGIEFHGRDSRGAWRRLAARPEMTRRATEDLRRPAVRALKRAGFRYLLTPVGQSDAGPLGRLIAGHEKEWGLELAAESGGIHLFRIP